MPTQITIPETKHVCVRGTEWLEEGMPHCYG